MATEQEWRRRVREWRASGESAREFAASRGLNAGTLAWWASRLGRRRTTKQAVELVEVQVARTPEASARTIDVVLRSGHTVRVSSGFDAVLFRAVVKALDGE